MVHSVSENLIKGKNFVLEKKTKKINHLLRFKVYNI